MSSYSITRVGLPITNETVTSEFIDIVTQLKTNSKWIGVMTSNDEQNSPAGYRILDEHGVDYTVLSIWNTDRDPIKATLNLMSQLKDLHQKQLFDHVVLFTPGNPFIDDAITKVLLSVYDDIPVISTKGAPEIAADIVANLSGLNTDIRNYYDDFILSKNIKIDKTKATIFSCLQKIYGVDLKSVITNLKPDRVITVSIGDIVVTQQYNYGEILNVSQELSESETSYTFAFIFN
jgi:hypothetical protein